MIVSLDIIVKMNRSNAVLTCVLGGAVVAEGKNRDAQISQVENYVRLILNNTVKIEQLILHLLNRLFVLFSV